MPATHDKPRLVGAIVPVPKLTREERDAAYALLSAYYSGTDSKRFEQDLDAKQYVITMRDSRTLELKGFCTVHVGTVRVRGRKATTIFTGDTVVDQAYWGQKVLHTQFSKLLLREKLRHPFRPLYWFLISKGYKTYKIMVRTCANMIPRFDRTAPAPEQQLLHQLASERFGERYDPATGIIQSGGYSEHVREGVSPITTELLNADPHVRFFADRNPGHGDGDELACLAKMQYRDMLGTMVRAARKRRRT